MTTDRAKPTTGDAYEAISTAELIRYLRERAGIRSDTDAHLMIEAAARLSERRGDWQGIESAPKYKDVLLFQHSIQIGSVGSDGMGLRQGDNVQMGDKLFKPTHWMPLPKEPK